MLCVIRMVQIQPCEHVLGGAGYTVSTQKHELDHTYHTNHTDHLPWKI